MARWGCNRGTLAMRAFTRWGGGPRYSSKPVLSVVEGLSRTVGDVNSTLACALVCAKIGVRVAHVEAGLQGSGEGAIHNSLFAIRHYR